MKDVLEMIRKIAAFATLLLRLFRWLFPSADVAKNRPLPNVSVAAAQRDSALVVKKKSTSTLLLVIKKKCLLGKFSSDDLPAVGAVIIVDWRSGSARDTIEVSHWSSHDETRGGFAIKGSTHMVKFTGMFYTTGCVVHSGEPLTNPAIFNDLIGVAEDKTKILQEHYIGKLKATVKLDEGPDGYRWTLCGVVEYFKKWNSMIPDQQLSYKGVVGAIKQGPSKASHYITSRYFPRDVIFLSGKNVKPREGWSHVVGPVCLSIKSDLHTSRSSDPFRADVDVEYIGCTDEHGNVIVWSEQLEFVIDPHGHFQGLAYGLYNIRAVRHYRDLEFPKWKVVQVGRRFKTFHGDAICIARYLGVSSSPTKRHESKRNNHRNYNRSTGNGADEKFDMSLMACGKLNGSVEADVVGYGDRAGRAFASSKLYKEEKMSTKDAEEAMCICLHRCLESIKVRDAIKQADPDFFDSLVAALMRA
ncbi:hypothetical protein GCK32_008120 [Trichostrongylus colubriformis]|uniref:Uncharacterized protein n=1 Tax=Trichostrongylus colubriformis TaxID=6319 RepID=A0AAN8FPN9_TRICO